MIVRQSIAGAVLLAGGLLLLAGCGESAAKKEAEEKDHLKILALQFGKYLGAHRGAGPANEQQFKDFLKSRKTELAEMQINDIDALFTSPRDGQPYVIVYGFKPGPSPSPAGRVIAYEQKGVDGRRFVAFDTTAVQEMDETKFQSVVGKK